MPMTKTPLFIVTVLLSSSLIPQPILARQVSDAGERYTNSHDEQITVTGIVRWEDGTPASGIPMSCGRRTLANGEFYCSVLKPLYSGSGVHRIHPKGFYPKYSKEPWYWKSLTQPVEAKVHEQYTEFVLKRNLTPEQFEQVSTQPYKKYLKEKQLIERKRLRYEEYLKEKTLLDSK